MIHAEANAFVICGRRKAISYFSTLLPAGVTQLAASYGIEKIVCCRRVRKATWRTTLRRIRIELVKITPDYAALLPERKRSPSRTTTSGNAVEWQAFRW